MVFYKYSGDFVCIIYGVHHTQKGWNYAGG